MIYKLFRRGMYGVAIGGVFTFAMLTILMFQKIQAPVNYLWKYMLASLIVGVFFGWASLIFDYDRWSPLQKTIIHFSISIVFYFSVALTMQWIPLTIKFITLSIIIFIIVYTIYWLSFYIYFKRIEQSLNKDLQKFD